MKKVLFTLALVVATFVSANAQFYVGGALGFESNSEESRTDPKSAFGIAPGVGYYINERFDVGLDFGFASREDQNETKHTGWGIAPYARYSFFQLGKFEVIGKASLAFGGEEIKYAGSIPTAKETTLGFSVTPILAYSLTEKVVLFTTLNCLSLDFTSISPDGGDSYSHFGFNANSNNLVNTGNIGIGFIYKF